MIKKVNMNLLREQVFYATLLMFVTFLPLSEAFVSISAALLLLQGLVLTSWKHSSLKGERRTFLFMVMSIFIVYLLGLIFTQDFSFGIYELKKVVFWIVIPLAIFISPRLTLKKFRNVLFMFIFSVFIASVIATVKLIFREFFQIEDFREITYVSHIRFSFQIVLTIIISFYFILEGKIIQSTNYAKYLLVAFLIWISIFLILLRSITGIGVFLGISFILTILFIFQLKNINVRIALLLLLVLIVTVPVIYVDKVWKEFYNVEELNPNNVEKYTLSGNSYVFNFESKAKENGNWVNAYICEKELKKEWNKLSKLQYDSLDLNGYRVGNTLIRYLSSKGLRKDSVGISKLVQADIKAIERGIANHLYLDKRFSLYPRIYETIWEYDRYKETGDANKQSFSQRIEFVKASFFLIKRNFWLGIGTGNWKIEYNNAYNEMGSKLNPENRGPSHNQYLNYMVKFGIVGFIFIISMLLIPFFSLSHRNNFVFVFFLIAMAIANFGDANFESHMGLSFFSFFYCLFLWHTPTKFKHFPV